MKDNIKPEDLHAVNTKSFCNTQAKGKANMNITQLETEIINAIKIESKEIEFLINKHNEEKDEYLGSLIAFVKKCFKKHNQE